MDALRKAEEAKRQAAQKQHEGKEQEAQSVASVPTAVDNLQALEESLEFERELSSNMENPEKSEPAAAGITDVPFDFEIDENFALDEQVPVKGKKENESKAKESFSEEAPGESSAEDVDYIQPDALSRFASSAKTPAQAAQILETEASTDEARDAVGKVEKKEESVAESSTESVPKIESLGLTLEEQHPSVERPSIIGSAEDIPSASAVERKSEPDQLEPEQAASLAIRALRNDDKESEVASEADNSQRPSKAATSAKFAEESRKRESARAVFSAKHRGRDKGARKKLIAAAAVVALLPLAGVGYLLLESMGILSSGNQYTIPPDFRASSGPYVDPTEQALLAENALPDLSSESDLPPAIEQEVAFVEPIVAQTPAEIVAERPVAALVNETPVLIEQESVALETPSVAQLEEAAIESALARTPITPSAETVADAQIQTPDPISITRTDNTERVDPQLTQAYAAYRGNDFIGARARYQQVLRDKPNNRDAMLGLAAVAMRLGDAPSARESYIKLLELDPRDVHARVGLLETMPASDPVQLESELRALFAAHPEVAQLAFALGNHFAAQRRWSDAQQSYYDALLAAKAGGKGPISPDYAFNLAVSLERLNQLRPAYTFYREALEQSQHETPGFDIRVLRERLDAIERVLP